jgi:hypothetical protein
MNRCAMCGYGTEREWHDHGICDECRRYLDQAFWEFEIDDDIPDPATDAYITQRPGASRGPRAPKTHPPRETPTDDHF